MDIQAGENYLTRDGTRASVWEWGKDGQGTECWKGTVQGGGLNCWAATGEDLYGTKAWDLVAPIAKPSKSIKASVQLTKKGE